MKKVQSLNGKLPALGRFLTKSVDHTLPFFLVLKTHMGKKDIEWSKEVEEAFEK